MRPRAIGLVLGGVAGVLLTLGGLALIYRPQSASATPTQQATPPTSYVPSCPGPTYSADGNVSPLFCTVINPLAVKFYRPLFPRLFALGRDASPVQVENALKSGLKIQHGTVPEMCSASKLWHWRWHWHFAWNPADAAVTGLPNACDY